MYGPLKKNIQSGGDYITTTYDTNSISAESTISSISQSTFAEITRLSNVSTFNELATLSIEQIAALIAALNTQIGVENTNITANQSEIALIQANINRVPGGFQSEYDKANEEYISVKRAYDTATAILEYDQSTLSTKLIELDNLSSLSSFYTSSLEGYQEQYSSLWTTIQLNNSTIDGNESEYQRKLREYTAYEINYSIAVHNLQSSIDSLNLYSSMLSTDTYHYHSTSTVYGNLLNEYIYFSTHNLSTSRYLFMSTNNYLSSLLANQSTQLDKYLSTSTALNIANLQLTAAQAKYDYDNAVAIETSSIISYNSVESQIRALIENTTVQVGDAYDIDYYRNYTPPPGQELTYSTLFVLLSTMSISMYSTSQNRHMLEQNHDLIEADTLRSILEILDDNISTARYTYNLELRNQSSVISTISGLSTRIAYTNRAEQEWYSTLSSLSTAYLDELSTYNGIKASISSYIHVQDRLSSYLRSTNTTISLLTGQSSLYSISAASYMEKYLQYSTLEAAAESSIIGYAGIRLGINSTIAGLNSQIGIYTAAVSTEFIELLANTNIYYTNLKNDFNNELDAYKYGIQEWDSFIGYICSELLINKVNLYTAIDSITFSLQDNITPERRDELNTTRSTYITRQTVIQDIINVLNVLDLKFARVLELVETERRNKELFVDTRSILTVHDIAVFREPLQKSVVQNDYINQLGNLNSRVNSINSNILQRNQLLSDLYGIINPQIEILNGLSLFQYVLPDPVTTNAGPFNLDKSAYEIRAQLDYGLNSELYPLVYNVPINTTTII
jgi:hypothetical protein